jgi:hypothetical protein
MRDPRQGVGNAFAPSLWGQHRVTMVELKYWATAFVRLHMDEQIAWGWCQECPVGVVGMAILLHM